MSMMKLEFRGEVLRLGVKEGADKAELRKFAELIEFHPAKCPKVIWGARSINFKVSNSSSWVAMDCKALDETGGAVVEKQGEIELPENCVCVVSVHSSSDFKAVYEFETNGSFDPEKLKIMRKFVKVPIWKYDPQGERTWCDAFKKPLLVTEVLYDGQVVEGRLELGEDEEEWDEDVSGEYCTAQVIHKSDDKCYNSEAWTLLSGDYEKVDEPKAVEFQLTKVGFHKLKVFGLLKSELDCGLTDFMDGGTDNVWRVSFEKAARLKALFEAAGATVAVQEGKCAYRRLEDGQDFVFAAR